LRDDQNVIRLSLHLLMCELSQWPYILSICQLRLNSVGPQTVRTAPVVNHLSPNWSIDLVRHWHVRLQKGKELASGQKIMPDPS